MAKKDTATLAKPVKDESDKPHKYDVQDTVNTVLKLVEIDKNPNALFESNGKVFINYPNCEYQEALEDGNRVLNCSVTSYEMNLLSTQNKNLYAALTHTTLMTSNHTLSGEELGKIIRTLHGMARTNPQEMYNRCAFYNDALYYDMSDNSNIIKITAGKWEVLHNKNEVIFERVSHQIPQTMPSMNGDGDAKLILKYLNLQNDDDKMLMVCYIVACFLAHVESVLLQIIGGATDGKTTFTRILKSTIDHSRTLTGLGIKKNDDKALLLDLKHHYYTCFENVSKISESQSDIFSRAMTGLDDETRALYTDDDTVFISIKRKVLINGLDTSTNKTDALSRSLIIQLPPLTKRMDFDDMMSNFEADKPQILAGIFDVLAELLNMDIEPVKLHPGIRMTTFMKYGNAISKILGYGDGEFIRAYTEKFKSLALEAVTRNVTGNAVLNYLMQSDSGVLKGSVHEVHSIIRSYDNSVTEYAVPFGKDLGGLIQNFKELNITVESTKKGNNRGWVIIDNNHKMDDNFDKPPKPKNEPEVPPINAWSEEVGEEIII